MSHFCAACESDDASLPHSGWGCVCDCDDCRDKAVVREVENIKYKASEDYATWVDERHAATIKAEQENSKRNGDVLDQTVQDLFHKIADWEGRIADLSRRVGALEEKVTALSGAPVAQTASVNDLRNSAGTPVQVRCPDGRTLGVGDLIVTEAEYAAMPVGSIVASRAEDEPQTLWFKTSTDPWMQWQQADPSVRTSNENRAGVPHRIVRIGYDSAEQTMPEPFTSIQPGDVIHTAAEFAALPADSIVAPDGQPPVWKDANFWEPVGVGSKGMAADNPGGCVVLRIGSGWREKGKQIEAIPEPPVGSVVLDKDGVVWQRRSDHTERFWESVEADTSLHTWEDLWADPDYAPLTLIHEGTVDE